MWKFLAYSISDSSQYLFYHLGEFLVFLKKYFIYLFLERGREKEGEKHQCVVAYWAPPTGDLACNPGTCPVWLGIEPKVVRRPALNPLSHTSRGAITVFSDWVVQRSAMKLPDSSNQYLPSLLFHRFLLGNQNLSPHHLPQPQVPNISDHQFLFIVVLPVSHFSCYINNYAAITGPCWGLTLLSSYKHITWCLIWRTPSDFN